MRIQLKAVIALGTLGFVAACSSSPPEPTSPLAGAGGEAGGGAPATNAGSGGAPASSGGGSAGTLAETGGASGSMSGTSSGGGASGGGAAGASAAPTNFTCNEYLGLLTTNEWYSQGFESDGVDGTKWQLKYHHYGYVGTWADPNSPFWSDTGDSFTLTQGSSIQSPCAMSSAAPDRLVFAALDWEMLTEDAWVTALEAALATFKAKYPSLRWVELMTMIRCPGNQMCNPNANYGPGANMTASRQDCYVPPYEDSALAKVASLHPDFVSVGPKVEALACRMPIDGAHLSVESNQHAAQVIATYYAAHP
ncbi:MAG TPA: hypothetical protein VNW92_31070 [Polyangiaceae bacterium]|jgi:hypothetical protein|nr:hypothetical protein [Polyangiaceae bacterium]